MEVAAARTVHPSIATAISESAAAVPDGFAYFIEPRYGGLSAGTLRIADAQRQDVAEDRAAAIVGLLAELHEHMGS